MTSVDADLFRASTCLVNSSAMKAFSSAKEAGFWGRFLHPREWFAGLVGVLTPASVQFGTETANASLNVCKLASSAGSSASGGGNAKRG